MGPGPNIRTVPHARLSRGRGTSGHVVKLSEWWCGVRRGGKGGGKGHGRVAATAEVEDASASESRGSVLLRLGSAVLLIEAGVGRTYSGHVSQSPRASITYTLSEPVTCVSQRINKGGRSNAQGGRN